MLWETIAEENNCTMDCNISNLNKNSSSRRVRRALTNNNSSNNSNNNNMLMAMDAEEELSFYDDDVHALPSPSQRSVSPALLGLLSPEGSPQRFQIVRQPKLLQQQQQQHQQHQLAPAAAATASSAVTPARSFRIFNSLSSTGSMESSMDDEYMELFEMESFAGIHQAPPALAMPSGLNSLISGQIKVTPKSPEALSIMMRRPSVRRCLSMTETNSNQLSLQQHQHQQQQQQQLQPKTPETARDCFKRPEPPASASCSPIQSKRHRCVEKENCPNSAAINPSSSERGPKMSRFLRNLDRERNTHAYPALHYPEIYLLHNGYKEFYETQPELCQPNAYRPMLEPAYNEAYRHFRAKSKSWNGDGCGGAGTGRSKKSRSRLML
ncbi:uncharacterized protein Dvir_GJ14225 [Drosophila virilis]|uniref:protein-tyrosine-phosphatase n=1 Tax=Drosophila virilis TaxID=7244 RepID=B4MBV2_DROVI|nr:uncharacterized protein Dvir_GJ14225 [Drosophila virilis]